MSSRIAIVLLVCVIAVLFVMDALGLSFFRGSLDEKKLGTLGEWVSGVGAVAAVSIALAELASQRRLHEAEQYRLLSAWLEQSLDAHGEAQSILNVENSTRHPITMWSVSLENPTIADLKCHHTSGVLIPGSNQFRLPSNDSAVQEITLKTQLTLRFVDRGGTAWELPPTGTLRKMRRPPDSSTCTNRDRGES